MLLPTRIAYPFNCRLIPSQHSLIATGYVEGIVLRCTCPAVRLFVYECPNEMGRSHAIFLGLFDAISYGIFDSFFSGDGMQRRSGSRGTSACALLCIIAVLLPTVYSAHFLIAPQKFLHSVLFDHHLERDGDHSQCRNILECFDAHAQRCQSRFSPRAMAFMRVMCISSCPHGNESTISSARTRGLMMLLFLRFWPATSLEKEVILNVSKSLSQFRLLDRFFVYVRVCFSSPYTFCNSFTTRLPRISIQF
jgi:hypothetical protein